MAAMLFSRMISCSRLTPCNIWSHGKWKQALWLPRLFCSFVSSTPCRHQRLLLFQLDHRMSFKHVFTTSFHSQLAYSTVTRPNVRFPDHSMIKFVEEENEYFHKYLEDSEEFKECILSDNIRESSESVNLALCSSILSSVLTETFDTSHEHVLRCLKHLSNLPSHQKNDLFVNESFKMLCSCLTNSLSEMNESMFWDSMRTLKIFDFRRCITNRDRTLRLDIAKAFDKECLKRSSSWDIRSHLLAADFYYHFRYSAMAWNRFMPKFMTTLERNLCDLSKSEVVVLMFHVNLHRHSPESVLFKLSQVIHSRINEFSGNDLGIIALGFFKSKQIVRNHPLLDNLVPVLKDKVDAMEDVCLSAVMKYLQRLTHKRMVKAVPHTINKLIDLQPHLLPRMKDVKISTSLHVISMYENIHDISEGMIIELCKKLLTENIQHWRIKDLAKTCKLLGNLSCPVQDKRLAFEKIVSELECDSRDYERRQFLDSLCTCLLGLSLEGIYPQNLIQQIFSKDGQDFFDKLAMDFRRDLYQLSESVKIEFPDYAGPLLAQRLVPNFAKATTQKYNSQIRKNGQVSKKPGHGSVRESMMLDMVQTYSRVLGGSEFLQVGFLLSHYQTPDIELRVHPCGRPVPVSKWPSNGYNGSNAKGGSKNLVASQLLDMATREPTRKIAVLLHGINAYYTLRLRDGTSVQTLTGLHAAKGRQLQKLGYEVVQIPHFEYSQVTQKYDYLKMKTFGTFFDDLD